MRISHTNKNGVIKKVSSMRKSNETMYVCTYCYILSTERRAHGHLSKKNRIVSGT